MELWWVLSCATLDMLEEYEIHTYKCYNIQMFYSLSVSFYNLKIRILNFWRNYKLNSERLQGRLLVIPDPVPCIFEKPFSYSV